MVDKWYSHDEVAQVLVVVWLAVPEGFDVRNENRISCQEQQDAGPQQTSRQLQTQMHAKLL